MRVLICGGGVIGASIAYFLSCRGVQVTVIERTGVACAASGKSGGFLARDWCDGTPLQELARRSFDLHGELADELGGDWGYRRMNTFGGYAGFGRRGHNEAEVAWLSPAVTVSRELGSSETTAQVHPAQFTTAMMQAAIARGASLRSGRVTGLVRQGGTGRIAGVDIDGETIESDAVVIAMGPWSILAAVWLPLPPVFGLKGHSLVFDTGSSVPAEAAFIEYQEPATGAVHSPELFPRTDGTTYVCGISTSDSPLPIDPATVVPDPGTIERLRRMCHDLSPVLASSNILAQQACFRPVTRDGLPLIGGILGVEGAYVATGHSVWGILNAPATGEAMAELITEGAARTTDLSPFRPDRLRPLDPARLRLG
jgi:glycine/D-amino acid oxidase-like deaminating enzyme